MGKVFNLILLYDCQIFRHRHFSPLVHFLFFDLELNKCHLYFILRGCNPPKYKKGKPMKALLPRPHRPMRSFESLTQEDVFLTALIYGFFALYCFNLISLAVFFMLTFIYVVRVFTIRHEKSHLGRKNQSGLWGVLTTYITFYHTPYQESFIGKRDKHLAHHRSHIQNRKSNFTEDPHQVLEGCWWISLCSAIFYEEVMLISELKKNPTLTKDRWQTLLTSVLVLTLTGLLAGLENLVVLILCYRLSMTIAWFYFSYFLHSEPIYSNISKLGDMTPAWIKSSIELILGSGHVTSTLYHKYHHENPNQNLIFK